VSEALGGLEGEVAERQTRKTTRLRLQIIQTQKLEGLEGSDWSESSIKLFEKAPLAKSDG